MSGRIELRPGLTGDAVSIAALAFYRRMGYADVGATTYSIEGNTYGNCVLAKQLSAA